MDENKEIVKDTTTTINVTPFDQPDHPSAALDVAQAAQLNEPWMQQWRLHLAWMYIAVCSYDFLIAPLIVQITQLVETAFRLPYSYTQWNPITTQGGAFFHITILGILGVSAFTKGKTQTVIAENAPDYSGRPHRISS